MSQQLEAQLKQHFDLDSFRHGQKQIIDSVLGRKDVLALMPTGGGKSLCFQLPAMLSDGITLVISPLIALMNDQVQSLQKLGLPAGCIHSGMSVDEKKVVFSDLKAAQSFLLYISPERVQQANFLTWFREQNINLIAIDEAHCVSQWGHDFRPEYAQISELRKLKPEVPIIGLTATATPLVKKDIIRQLGLKKPIEHVYGFYRPNLYYQVEFCDDEYDKQTYVLGAVKQTPEGRILIYCGTRKGAEEWAEYLSAKSHSASFYHAGLSPRERKEIEQKYASGEIRILAATNAFGMGIDHPDVRLVVHTQVPGNLESYYQEIGRAGRDGLDSTCLLVYSKKDKGLQSFFIQTSKAESRIKNMRWEALDAMINYAEGSECRHADILTYFKDSNRIKSCGHCDTCDPKSVRRIKPIVGSSLGGPAPKPKKKKKKGWQPDPSFTPEQNAWVEEIRAWRKDYASSQDIPAFMVFSDKTLRDLVSKMPLTVDELGYVYGLGDAKIEAFGEELILEVRQLWD
ncbi:MAG: ATP-dependent DNA helicase RecQ [Bdellovibrionales bacterium]|nr:ATP-dependent DNA helicase RecQ [Bdellovibrionales bacterium]